MTMIEGQVYRCLNRKCGCEIKVLHSSIHGSTNPTCCCGTEMKKPYFKPTVRAVSSGPELMMVSRAKKD